MSRDTTADKSLEKNSAGRMPLRMFFGWVLIGLAVVLPVRWFQGLLRLSALLWKRRNPYLYSHLDKYSKRNKLIQQVKRFILKGFNTPAHLVMAHRMLRVGWSSHAQALKMKGNPASCWAGMSNLALTIDVTSRCNLDCVGCYSKNDRGGGEISGEQLATLARSAWNHGTGILFLLGGEPLLNPALSEAAAVLPDVAFIVFTNGTLADFSWLKRVRKLGNVYPIFSLEGNEQLTDARRGQGVFACVREAIRHCAELRLLHGVSFTISRENWEIITDANFLRGTFNFYTRLIMYTRVFSIGNCSGIEAPPQSVLNGPFKERLQILRKDRAFHPLTFQLPDDEWRLGNGSCVGYGRFFFHVNVDGSASPCILSRGTRFRRDRPFEYESLRRAVIENQRKNQHNSLSCLAASEELTGER
jgi:MoaA/NifB/PqqE/SkfB family radical SAM enzyme